MFFLSLALFNKAQTFLAHLHFICWCKVPIDGGTARLQAALGNPEYFKCLQFSVTVMSKHTDLFKGATRLQSKSTQKNTVRQYPIPGFLTSSLPSTQVWAMTLSLQRIRKSTGRMPDANAGCLLLMFSFLHMEDYNSFLLQNILSLENQGIFLYIWGD